MKSVGTNALGNNGGRFYSFLSKPVLIDCTFTVAPSNTNGLGISNLVGAGVQDVFMYTSQTAGAGNSGFVNPLTANASKGFALIKLANNYNRYCGGFDGVVSPLSGTNVAINGTALTVGQPYVISSVGAGAAGAATIAPVADVSGSLASTWFSLYDGYGNTFIVWFSVSGVGSAPVGVSGTLVQQSISTNASAATIGAALVTTISNLPSGISGVNSFTATGTTTVTVTNTAAAPLPGAPADGKIATGFTFASTVYKTNAQNWRNVGLPSGVKPAIGAAFVASATGDSTGGGSSGQVQVPSVSGIISVELVGTPSAMLAPVPLGPSQNVGGWLMVQFLAPTVSGSAYDTPMIPTAPAAGSSVGMSFYVEVGSAVIAGE